MSLDQTAVRAMVESGGASVAHLAKHFDVSIGEIEKFLDENGITRPSGLHPQYRHMIKLMTAERPEPVDWESLVYDDSDRRFINGIDTVTTEGKIDAQSILRYYQQHDDQLHCWYSNKPAQSILAVDGDAQNFLISNLLPMDKDVGTERGLETPLYSVASKKFEFDHRGPEAGSMLKVDIFIHARVDPKYGVTLNEPYLDAMVDQWLRPYLDGFHPRAILPDGMPLTPELLVLWTWKHLSTVAFLKGLSRIEIEFVGIVAALSKDLYLQMVVGLMQRAVQSRAVARPSGLILPGTQPPGNQAPILNR